MKRAAPTWPREAPITAVLVSLPLMLFAGLLVYAVWQQQQQQLELQQRARARAVAVAIEKEIAGTTRQLEFIASSPLFDDGRIDVFASDARRALAANPQWSNLLVFGTAARQLLNMSNSLPVNDPPITQKYAEQTLTTGNPAVSDIYRELSSGRAAVFVTVPVTREGRVIYALSAALDFAPIDSLLLQADDDYTAVVGLFDSQYQFISRSVLPNEHRGRHPPPEFITAVSGDFSGWGRSNTLDGTSVFTAWTRVASTPWTVGVAVPAAAADALLYRHLSALAVVELLILVMAIPIAVRLRREALERESAQAERDRLFALEREARAQAEAANKAKDGFLAMLGHELRNPLAAVSNAVHLLESDRTTPASLAFARGVISRQTAHLTRLIDDLLDVSRVITGKVSLRRELIDLTQLAHGAINSLRTADKSNAQRITISAAQAFVEGDATRLEQVVVNLVSNALAHTQAGDHVHVSLEVLREHVVLGVRDDGIGLAPEELDRVFELFYQANGDLHRKGGLGIGLTLVRSIVELHGGTITVASDGIGKGAQFTVRLPAVDTPRVEMKVAPMSVDRNPPRSILLVEDNEDARESLAELLRMEGHTVHEAADGERGVSAALESKADIALVDIGLPEIDGYEVARRLRAGSTHEMTLIALTGYGQPEDRRHALEAGFDDHLTKPADMEKLRALIATAGRKPTPRGRSA
jgi:signal transduction histidine kinase/ActR/RegA family two-component response regulator